ncbi:MAG TPA: OB-fold nucleic acid binding domain-containing protein, partial [Rhodocyclaceae bacterium]|nr:OB-fold nucleic acid binding domain-containing protein [Rhodocyclaceae bacterium]
MSAAENTPDSTAPVQQDENHIIAERRAKLTEWRSTGQAYPNNFRRENYAGKLASVHSEKSREQLEIAPISVRVAGRIMLKRVMGKASFVTIQDMSGRIQLFVSRDNVGEEVYADFKRWDIGDIVGAAGTLMKTKTDELSVQVTEFQLLTKTLRPLPEKFHGLSDVEQKYRQRYLDLITNDHSRATFMAR